jgi:hypothetical protein
MGGSRGDRRDFLFVAVLQVHRLDDQDTSPPRGGR